MGTMVSVFATGLPFTTFFSQVTSWSYAAITRVSLVPSFASAGSRVLPPSEYATVREASVFFAAEVLFALVPQAETPRTAARPSATVERIRFVMRCLSCALLWWSLWVSCRGGAERMLSVRHGAQPRVERITETVAQQVETENGCRDGCTGEERHPPFTGDDVAATVGNHDTPLRRRWLCTQPNEAQSRGRENGVPHAECTAHDDGCDSVWQDVPEQDGSVAQTDCGGCFDKLAFP